MGYRIEYDHGECKFQVLKENRSRLPGLTAGALAAFLILTHLFWPAGDSAIQDFLIPGDDVVTRKAAQTMVQELREGASLTQAVEVFCREIIDSAENPD